MKLLVFLNQILLANVVEDLGKLSRAHTKQNHFDIEGGLGNWIGIIVIT
jgi:hypothetical protein